MERQTERQTQRQAQRHRERTEVQTENSNSKTLFYKNCSLGLVKNLSNN